jgi:hypothetical protein
MYFEGELLYLHHFQIISFLNLKEGEAMRGDAKTYIPAISKGFPYPLPNPLTGTTSTRDFVSLAVGSSLATLAMK